MRKVLPLLVLLAWAPRSLSSPQFVEAEHLPDTEAVRRGSDTVFTVTSQTLFVDTFSRVDPAHTSSLQNDELNMWFAGRDFAPEESLSIDVEDPDGITATNVTIHWRHDDGGPNFGGGTFGPWMSKMMTFKTAFGETDEGTYTAIIGNDGAEDASPPVGDQIIWKAGTTVQYYVRVEDDLANVATFPADISAALDFRVHPMGNTTPTGERILVVDDARLSVLDYENSGQFDPNALMKIFTDPAFVAIDSLFMDALDVLYGIPYEDSTLAEIVDVYRVGGVGSAIQTEPNAFEIKAMGERIVGGLLTMTGLPKYDAVIWLNSTRNSDTFQTSTRLALGTFLDNGGRVISFGDGVAFDLGVGGNNVDPNFLSDYMGIDFPTSLDDATGSRVLSVLGETTTEYDMFDLGVYGETVPRDFDRLTLTTTPGTSSLSHRVLFAYSNGAVADDGRAAVIENATISGGHMIHSGFGGERFHSREAIACYLDVALHDIIGLNDPSFECPTIRDYGTDVPLLAGDNLAIGAIKTHPNPFREGTSLSFSLSSPTFVSIDVYDAAGRRVRTLREDLMEERNHEVWWDGRTDDGTSVAAGIYFFRIVADGHVTSEKTLLLK